MSPAIIHSRKKWKRIREGVQREVHLFSHESMWFMPFLASNVSLECAASERRILRQFCFTCVGKQSSNQRKYWVLLELENQPKIILRFVTITLRASFALTSSFCMLFVAHERVGRLAPNMSPNMNYFGLKFSNFRHKFLFQNYLFNFLSAEVTKKVAPLL